MILPSKASPGYGFARARDLAFSAVRELWRVRQSEGMTQVDLAERMDRDAAWVSRKLSGPSNWTLRTFGDLADALDGEIEIKLHDLRTGHDQSNFDAYADDELPQVMAQGDRGFSRNSAGIGGERV